MRLFYSFQRKNMPSAFIIVLVLTIPALQTDLPAWNGWQGTGNMTGSNMTEIQTTITNNPIINTTTSDQIDAIAQTISLHLNDLWAPAWNVVITKGPSGYDCVVYGYAFRNHWMWINGVAIPGSTEVLAYIIWKESNCHTWSLFNTFLQSPSTFPTDVTVTGYIFTRIHTDVWAEAFAFVNYLNAQSATDSRAFTIILSQYIQTAFQGYICLVNNNFRQRRGPQARQTITSDPIGRYFVFQTR